MREPIHIAHIVQELARQNLLPAIVFRTARNQCDVDAERAAANPRLRLPPIQQRELILKINQIVERHEMDSELIKTHPHYNSLILTGIGAHHAGQLLIWRLLLEELMAEGVLRVLVATGTVAAGVDFPARTVVITAHSRRGSDGYRKLTSAEFQQMSGRAGRRGKDTVGFCVAAPSAFCDARALLEISKRPPEPLESSYFPSPSTVLNLLRYRNVDDLRYTVERSLAAFVDRKNAKTLVSEAVEEADSLPSLARAIMYEELSLDFPSADCVNVNRVNVNRVNVNRVNVNRSVVVQELSKEERKTMKRVRRYKREADALAGRQLVFLDQAFSGLQRLGYLDGLTLSEKGNWAANLCTSLVLELSEMIEAKLFENVSAETLVAIVASIAGDPHRNYLSTKSQVLSDEQFSTLEDILERVQDNPMPGAAERRSIIPAAAYTALSWLQAEDWQQFRSILVLSGVAEGDAARLITQTAEQMNQLARLTETHSALALRAEEAKRRLLRPPLTEAINLETF